MVGYRFKPNLIDILKEVSDPEIPVLSVLDLGIIKEIQEDGDLIKIFIFPTYSGCPAMDMISQEIKLAFIRHGYENIEVHIVLSPAWTTDLISLEGRKKLFEYGIAPPVSESSDKLALIGQKRIVVCPQCKSNETIMVSQFGSTPCKALFKCESCLEFFDYFKCLK